MFVLICFFTASILGIVWKKKWMFNFFVCRHFRPWPMVSVLKFNLLTRLEDELLGVWEKCVGVMAYLTVFLRHWSWSFICIFLAGIEFSVSWTVWKTRLSLCHISLHCPQEGCELCQAGWVPWRVWQTGLFPFRTGRSSIHYITNFSWQHKHVALILGLIKT